MRQWARRHVGPRDWVAVVGYDVADKLFDGAERALGRTIRVGSLPLRIKGVIAAKLTKPRGPIVGASVVCVLGLAAVIGVVAANAGNDEESEAAGPVVPLLWPAMCIGAGR